MASAATLPKLRFRPKCHGHFQAIYPVHVHIKNCNACKCQIPTHGLLVSSARSRPVLPVSAVGSGGGSSVAEDERKSGLSLQNAKTSVVSRDDETINVRVDLPGKATQKVFDEALTSLARDAPPVPGFRKSKGGSINYTKQHSAADAWQKPGHQVRSSGNTQHHCW
ncbi:hypothetical protein DAI22_01g432100 [Oryza sativa Japonica Group]|nr:hypothetical protein DAI22_01g432100 [Oryza sativa Japonica Group]